MMNYEDICDECFSCHWFIDNNDSENSCMGASKPCHEFFQNDNGKERER